MVAEKVHRSVDDFFGGPLSSSFGCPSPSTRGGCEHGAMSIHRHVSVDDFQHSVEDKIMALQDSRHDRHTTTATEPVATVVENHNLRLPFNFSSRTPAAETNGAPETRTVQVCFHLVCSRGSSMRSLFHYPWSKHHVACGCHPFSRRTPGARDRPGGRHRQQRRFSVRRHFSSTHASTSHGLPSVSMAIASLHHAKSHANAHRLHFHSRRRLHAVRSTWLGHGTGQQICSVTTSPDRATRMTPAPQEHCYRPVGIPPAHARQQAGQTARRSTAVLLGVHPGSHRQHPQFLHPLTPTRMMIERRGHGRCRWCQSKPNRRRPYPDHVAPQDSCQPRRAEEEATVYAARCGSERRTSATNSCELSMSTALVV